MGKGTTLSSLLTGLHEEREGGMHSQKDYPQMASLIAPPLGIPLYPVAQNGFLPLVGQAFGACNWAGCQPGLDSVALFAHGHQSLRAASTGSCEKKREDELSAETGQQGEILGSSGGLCIQLV